MRISRPWITRWTLLLLLIALGGCDTLSNAQYHIHDPSADAQNRERVLAIIQTAAINAGMVDRTETSKVPDTLAYFTEPVKDFPTTLGARRAGEYLVIDLYCFHPGGGAPPAFNVTKASLEDSLKAEFGRGWRLATDADWIPVHRSASAR